MTHLKTIDTRVDSNGHWQDLPDQNGNEEIWDGTQAMAAMGRRLYIVQNQRLHQVIDGHWQVLPDQNGKEDVWDGTQAMTATGRARVVGGQIPQQELFIVQDDRLHRVDSNGHWQVLADQNGNEQAWGGTEAMATLGRELYIVKRGRLFRVESDGQARELTS